MDASRDPIIAVASYSREVTVRGCSPSFFNIAPIFDCLDSTMPESAIKKHVTRFVDHVDSGEWTLTKTYPEVLLACETQRIQEIVERWVKQELEKSWVDDFHIKVATLEALQSLNG